MRAEYREEMAYAIVHHFPDGTKEQYEASIGAVHPSRDSLPEGQIYGPASGRRAGCIQQGIEGGLPTPPQETAFDVHNLQP